jgi:hypothetical protein
MKHGQLWEIMLNLSGFNLKRRQPKLTYFINFVILKTKMLLASINQEFSNKLPFKHSQSELSFIHFYNIVLLHNNGTIILEDLKLL